VLSLDCEGQVQELSAPLDVEDDRIARLGLIEQGPELRHARNVAAIHSVHDVARREATFT
jgi:hypothetical protein